ncbi:MAG: hypothetical protein V3T08_02795 [Gemmatimonadota bacterium]
MKRIGCLIWVCSALILLSAPRPAHAIFHLMVIDEVMTSYDGDPDVQFVECKMLALVQNFVTGTVLGAFGPTGTYLGDVLILPNDIAEATGPGVRFLMATQAFEDLTSLTPDFIIPPNLPLGSGMICWGAPGAGNAVPDPGSWDHTDPNQYTDCVAYGSYSGPTNDQSGNPTPLSPLGHSLERISETEDNATDFRCGDPATPENNTPGESASLPATTPCPSIPVLPGWGLPLLLALFTGAGTLLLLQRRTGLAPAPPPQ